MKKIFVLFFSAFMLIFHSATAFEISDIKNYPAIVVKTMVESDTLHKTTSKKTEIRNGEALRKILGDKKVKFDTEYVYIGDKKIEEKGYTTWYHYTSPKSKTKKPVYHLYYQKKRPMYEGQVGDTLAVIRKSDSEIVLLIVKQNSDAEKELYEIIGMLPNHTTNKESTFWQRLWNTESKQTEDYELEEETLPLPAIPEKSWVRVYFTPGTDCENNIIAEINNAKKIDIAVYSITNQNIVDAIIEAKERGAKIRVITDRLQSKGKHSLVDEIESAGIPVITNVGHKIMHNKFAIFDGKRIESGSYNWTESATESNAENCTFFEQENKTFSKQFEYLWDLYQK